MAHRERPPITTWRYRTCDAVVYGAADEYPLHGAGGPARIRNV